MKNQVKFPPTHPGKIIQRRFFKAHNLTAERVAQDIYLW